MAVGQSSSDSEAPEAPETAETPPADAAEHSQRVRSLDFSQPTKFTSEIKRKLTGALEPFGVAFGGWLAKELASEVELRLEGVSERSWAQATAQLPAASVAVAVDAPAIERQMLLCADLPLLLQALECMLGGSASQAQGERHLTSLDWKLANGLLEGVVKELSAAWGELNGPELELGELDVEGDGGVLVAPSEATLCATFASTIDGQPASMTLLVPWSAIEPFAERLRPGTAGQQRATQVSVVDEPRALRQGVASAQVLLRAEVGSVQMPVQQMLELLPGQLVRLDGRAEDGVRLFAEGVSLGRGRPGRSGTRRAIKLQWTEDPPVRADVYAKLGRAELERARSSVGAASESADGASILQSIFVRVWAELGRTHRPLGAALELSAGAVVELDQSVQAPVELFANGLCFANGSLVVSAEGAWGVQVAELV